MKPIRSYWRRFKAERKERKAFNRSTTASDPEWRDARYNSLFVKYEEGFINEKELLRGIHLKWHSTGLDFTINMLMLKQKFNTPKVSELAEKLMGFQENRRLNKLEVDKFKRLKREAEEKLEQRRQEEAAAKFDSSALISFLERR
jgi:hypothetical protein